MAGATFRLNTRWSAGADYSWRDRLTAASDPVSEVTVYANCWINKRDRLNT